ncbi:MAG: class I SAM-dependent methyltransferase [Gallionellaceae bacterium]
MDERIYRVAALANALAYDAGASLKYVEGAPHIKHAELRNLYAKLVVQVFDNAKEHTLTPVVLDLGAGEGSVTLPFLELGASVLAVDISPEQLDALKVKCADYADRLEVRCEDIYATLQGGDSKYDIIVANSFLHHVPDYLGMLKSAAMRLGPHGQIFSFQDPLRYDTLGKAGRIFSAVAYFAWRVVRGDVIAGLGRRIRRARGVYLEDSVADNAEYHVTRNGVDQDAIWELLEDLGFECEIVPYFSTQSSVFQPLGSILGVENTFAIVARKRSL